MEQTVSVEGVDFCRVFLKISRRGTHHGRCWSRHDGGGWYSVWERREGVLVCVLVRVLVLVLVLVLVELGSQVGRWSQRGPSVSAL